MKKLIVLYMVLSLTSVFISGQDQFLREVKNPRGPSQIVIRGGFLGNSASPDEVEIVPQEEERQQPVQLSSPREQTLPLQATLDARPIPDGGADNPFTNGNAGFGLRYNSQPAAPSGQVQPQPVQQVAPQPVQLSTPTVTQQQPQQLAQPAPVQQQILTLPQLPPGQQYVDVYGRPILFTQPQVSQPQPTAPPTTTPQPIPVQKQAFVDGYGRVLGQFETQQQVVSAGQQVIQSAPIVQNIIQQPAALEYPLLQKAPPSLTLHTYAIPAVRKVGDLLIPYAQKVQVTKPLKDGFVLPSPVAEAAVVKSKNKTVLSPKVVAPVAVNEIHAAHPVVHQVQTEVHAPAQVLVQEQQQLLVQEQQHVVVEQPHVAVGPQQLVQVAHAPQQLVQVAHAPQQLVQVAHAPQQLVQVQHQVAQAPQQIVVEQPQQLVQVPHHVPVAHAPQQLVQVQHQVPVAHPHLEVVHHAPQQVVVEQQHHIVPHLVETHHAPVVVKKVKQIAKVPVVPEFTLIHQPVLPKVLFQKHIFNVKHGSEPLIYQDLCTVYPYQKNLRACVLKKAVLPELHHPDIRTVNVEEAPPPTQQTDQTVIAGGSTIVSPLPPAPKPQAPSTPTVSVTISKNPPKNIQDTIKRESKAAAAAAAKEASASSQPDTAETRDTTGSGKSSRRRRKNSSAKVDGDGFKLV